MIKIERNPEKTNRFPLTFVANAGQTNLKVLYHSHGAECGIFFTHAAAVYNFIKSPVKGIASSLGPARGLALTQRFIGANPSVKVEGLHQGTGKVNYIKGDNSGNWCTNLCTYKEVAYRELWPGVDMIFSESNGQVKYKLILAPGAELENIRLTYDGSEQLSLDEKGNLLIINQLDILVDQRPQSYQETESEKLPVEIGFVPEQVNGKNIYCFKTKEAYNSYRPLMIEAGLDGSTFMEGYQSSYENETAVEDSGNVYVTGYNTAFKFPTAPGVFELPLNRLYDAFVTKLSADKKMLIYSTYLGGSRNDFGNKISLDSSGNAYIKGYTTSADFPTSPGSFDPSFKFGGDTFTAKLSPDGSKIIYWK